MTRYFAHVGGDVIGPSEPDDLKRYLTPDIYVCVEGGGEWILASDVPELKDLIPARYYALVAGNAAGPYTEEELDAIVQPELQICREGATEWVRAGDHPAFENRWNVSAERNLGERPRPASSNAPPARVGNTPESEERVSPPADMAPRLQELWRICRNASDELLEEQKAKHWKEYFKNEQKIIADELARRGMTSS